MRIHRFLCFSICADMMPYKEKSNARTDVITEKMLIGFSPPSRIPLYHTGAGNTTERKIKHERKLTNMEL